MLPLPRRPLALPILGLAAAFALGACGGGSEAEDEAQDLADEVAGQLGGYLEETRQVAEEVARLPEARGNDSAACNAALKRRAKTLDERYSSIGVIGADGLVLCLSIPFEPPVDASDRAYRLRALGSGDFSVGEYQVGRVTGVELLSTSLPVEGRPEAVALVPIDLEWLGRQVAKVDVPAGGELLVLDTLGTVLAGGDPRLRGTNLSGEALVQEVLDEREGEGEFSRDGESRTYAFTPVPGSDENLLVAAGVPD
jgi:hypothetical protein